MQMEAREERGKEADDKNLHLPCNSTPVNCITSGATSSLNLLIVPVQSLSNVPFRIALCKNFQHFNSLLSLHLSLPHHGRSDFSITRREVVSMILLLSSILREIFLPHGGRTPKIRAASNLLEPPKQWCKCFCLISVPQKH